MNNFFTRHAFKIIILAVFVLPFMTRGARKALTSNDNDVHDWLPTEYAETAEFNWFQKHFDNETFVLISWEGCTLDDQRLELLARKLVPAEVEVPVEDIVEPTSKAEAFASLDRETPLFKRVETGQRLLNRLTSPPLNLSEDEALKRLEGLFIGPDHAQTCAVITLTEKGKSDLRATVKKLYSVAATELDLPRERIRMGGPPVDNVAISQEGERTLLRLFIPAGFVGIGLAFWCLRSVRLTTMVFAAALYAGAASLAIVYYSNGTMNAILMSMPAVVYVAGISGAIHFANYYRDAVVESGVEGAAWCAVSHAWLPCILSAGTTAAGLLSLYTSELLPIRWFGLYSAAGVGATLLLLFFFLPAWMQLWPMKLNSLLDGSVPTAEDIALPKRWRRLLEGVVSHRRWVFATLMAVMIACGFGLLRSNTSIKLTKLFSPDAEIIQNYQWLEAKLGPLVPMEIIVRFDNDKCQMNMLERMELVSRVQDQLESINGIGNTMSAVTYAPSLQVKRAGPFVPVSTMRRILNKKLEDHRDEYMANDFVAVDGSEEIWRISARVGALNDIDYGTFVNDIRSRVEPALAAEREKIAKNQKDAKPAEAVATTSNATEQTAGVAAAAVAAVATTDVAVSDEGIRATYTGLVPLVYKAQRSMLNGLVVNFITDLLTVALVMSVVLLDLSAGLIILIPAAFPVVLVFGLMGWGGVLIDVGTVMTPTVALGVSVDDVVHFLIWYRKGLSQGKTRGQSVMLAYEGCARAMYQSWAVLGLGLAVFSLSTFVPTQRFGMLMFTLLTGVLIGNLLLLPVVLISPLGYFFGRRLTKKAEADALAASDANPATRAHEHVLPITTDKAVTEVPAPMSTRRDASHRTLKS